jgi:hypothetical protein
MTTRKSLDGLAHLSRVQNFLDVGERCVLASILCEIFGLLLHQDLNIAQLGNGDKGTASAKHSDYDKKESGQN